MSQETCRRRTNPVRDDTSIHTHMCYSEFNDIMPAIAEMDADAISIETTRSRMELLNAFADPPAGGVAYPLEIGPGVWDIHSPRVPDATEMTALLGLARLRLKDWQNWINSEYFDDLLVEGVLVVELKAVKALDDVHMPRRLSRGSDAMHNYFKAIGLQLCLLLDFGKPCLEIKRMAHGLCAALNHLRVLRASSFICAKTFLVL